MTALEGLFIGLLVAATLAIAWVAGLVVVRLFRSQR
jgi:hypothetical protein